MRFPGTADWHARNNQPFQLPKRLVAVAGTVYVTLGYNDPVSALDMATGEVFRTYEGTAGTDEILFYRGLLVLSINKSTHNPSKTGVPPVRKAIAVVNPTSGKTLWRTGDYAGIAAKTDSIAPNGRLELAVGDDRIHFSDRDAIVALDLGTGTELWRTPRVFGPKLNANFNTRMYELPVLVYSDGVVLFAQPEGMTSFHSVPGTLYAYSANDGSLLRKHRYGGWVHNTQPNVFVIDKTVWIHEHQEGAVLQGGKRMVLPGNVQGKLDYAVIGLDLHSGEEKTRIATKAVLNVGHHHRCYRNKATERFLLMSRRGVEFIDTETGEVDVNHWTRGDCQLGVMPCNGLLYTTPHPCSCYIDSKLNGFFALAPAAKAETGARASIRVKGAAFDKKRPAEISTGNDWPTFRGDALRSGTADSIVSPKPAPSWQTDLGAACGPLSVSGGMLYAPVIDRHRLVALEAAEGALYIAFKDGTVRCFK